MKSINAKVTKITLVLGLYVSVVSCTNESQTSSTKTQQTPGVTEVSQTQTVAEIGIDPTFRTLNCHNLLLRKLISKKGVKNYIYLKKTDLG